MHAVYRLLVVVPVDSTHARVTPLQGDVATGKQELEKHLKKAMVHFTKTFKEENTAL